MGKMFGDYIVSAERREDESAPEFATLNDGAACPSSSFPLSSRLNC